MRGTDGTASAWAGLERFPVLVPEDAMSLVHIGPCSSERGVIVSSQHGPLGLDEANGLVSIQRPLVTGPLLAFFKLPGRNKPLLAGLPIKPSDEEGIYLVFVTLVAKKRSPGQVERKSILEGQWDLVHPQSLLLDLEEPGSEVLHPGHVRETNGPAHAQLGGWGWPNVAQRSGSLRAEAEPRFAANPPRRALRRAFDIHPR